MYGYGINRLKINNTIVIMAYTVEPESDIVINN